MLVFELYCNVDAQFIGLRDHNETECLVNQALEQGHDVSIDGYPVGTTRICMDDLHHGSTIIVRTDTSDVSYNAIDPDQTGV